MARREHWMYVQAAVTPISPPIQAVLDLFDGPLGQVRFADIDSATLRRLAGEVEAAAAELEAQQAALDALRKATLEKQEHLLLQAQRALAYARVYAEGDEELSARLAQIHLARPAKRQKADSAEGEASGKKSSATARPPLSGASTARPSTADPADAASAVEPDGTEETDAARPAAAARRKGRDRARSVSLDEGAAES